MNLRVPLNQSLDKLLNKQYGIVDLWKIVIQIKLSEKELYLYKYARRDTNVAVQQMREEILKEDEVN